MKLYVRDKSKWVNFVHDVSEMRVLVDNYIPGTSIVIGDLAQFNASMKNMLLKFLEDNPQVDCYSSEDVTDDVLLSRFVSVIKEPALVTPISYDEFKTTSKGYESILGMSGKSSNRLYLYKAPDFVVNIMSLL